jgi:hypothetical protein
VLSCAPSPWSPPPSCLGSSISSSPTACCTAWGLAWSSSPRWTSCWVASPATVVASPSWSSQDPLQVRLAHEIRHSSTRITGEKKFSHIHLSNFVWKSVSV